MKRDGDGPNAFINIASAPVRRERSGLAGSLRGPKKLAAWRNMMVAGSCGDIADVGFMLVATDHLHYVSQEAYSAATSDFDFRHGASYAAGTALTYKTGGYGEPITLARDYQFSWVEGATSLHYMLVEVSPTTPEPGAVQRA